MNTNNYYLAGAILLTVCGVTFLTSPIYYDYKYGFEVNASGYSLYAGISFICLGCILLIANLRDRKRGLEDIYICPECERVFPLEEVHESLQCPDCKRMLVPLKGFYSKKRAKARAAKESDDLSEADSERR